MTIEPSSAKQTNKSPLIRASELAQYGFCQRAWWLGMVKQHPASGQQARDQGLAHHHQHAGQVDLARRWRCFGFLLLGIGSLILAAFFLFWLF